MRWLTSALFTVLAVLGSAQIPNDETTKSIREKIGTLRSLDDATRAKSTKEIALQIRALPAGNGKTMLALGLANLATEGDFGRDTLQAVTDTLAQTSKETPLPLRDGQPAPQYMELAQLARYENMRVNLNDESYRAAMKAVDDLDRERAKQDFTLTDIKGNSWTLSSLKGKVVLVNFWATWCPPCRKEMPDLNALYGEFKDKGFVILAISDEKAKTVEDFIAQKGYSYPILLDPDRAVNTKYHVEGIPKSFLYDRTGKLVGQTIDMRTRGQFLTLLAKAGLHE